jgi:DNA-binding NtrC family response regulator
MELSGIRLESVPWRAPASDEAEGVLRFRHLPDRYFSYYYYANPLLKPATAHLRGIILHEITALHRRIEYQEQKSRELEARLELAGTQNAFIGNSAPARKVLEYAEAVARTNIPILLQGPTGSGKGVLASYIHAHGAPASSSFVKMDCSTIPHELFESIVFGHAKGAFTGAHADSKGLLEKGNGGTVLIDEIQNLTPEDQAKLLHVLQEYTITPVGANRTVRLNVRFIIAANEDLEQKVREGKFRQDLFYRINTVVIRMPALKERHEDIPDLCTAFIRQFNAESGKSIDGLAPECYPLLSGYSWPGNVRELKNVITHACLFTPGGTVAPDTIRQYMAAAGRPAADTAAFPLQGDAGLGRISKAQFAAALSRHRGRAIPAAKELGVARNTVYYNLRRFGLKLADFR